MNLFVFTVAVFALTFIVGQAKISHPLRLWFSQTDLGSSPFGQGVVLGLLECNACLGFHLGWIASLLHLAPAELTTWWIAALYCCGTSLFLAKHTGLTDET